MIEIIYDKNKDAKDNIADKDTKEEKDSGGILKLPKNIRQIGSPAGSRRIYIEDYVVTYLNYISRPGSTHARGAILLGESKHSEIGDVLFISGAVAAQNLEFDMDESEFTQEAWTEIYDQVKEFFPELSVVGWFLSRMGFSTAVNEKIEKMHVDNFPGKDKVLYITDSLENEEAFYVYERGQMIKQKGYFIYYAKNEAMQEYIVKQKGGESGEEDTEIQRKDEELIKSYRDKNNRTKGVKSEGISLAYVASSFVVLAMLAMGITVISNYDRMKEMEESINRLELTAEENGDDFIETMVVPGDDSEDLNSEQDGKEEPEGSTQENDTDTEDMDTQQDSSETVEDGQGEEDISTEQTLPTITNGAPTYYIIKYGDSLTSIAIENYGSAIYVDDIAKANKMDVDDKIYEGDELILPSVTPR